jgi:hypothetical protein
MGAQDNAASAAMAAAATASADGVNRASLLRLSGIGIAGAVGGFLFWVLAKLTGTAPLPVSAGLWTIPALMLLGGFAAAIAVYVLTASDTAAMKTYVFASICGVCWQPIIASGVRMVSNATAVSQSAALVTQTAQVQQAAAGGNVDQINTALAQTVPAVTAALGATANADPDRKQEIVSRSQQAISQIQSTAAQAPDASVSALQKISVTAANNATPSVALNAIDSLRAIGADAQTRQNSSVMAKVRASLTKVGEQTTDPTVKAAAKNAADQIKQ